MKYFKLLFIMMLGSTIFLINCKRGQSSNTEKDSPKYSLRDTGPAGGLIFHIVDNDDGTKTYYEAAPYGWNRNFPDPRDKNTDPRVVWQMPRELIGPAAQGTAIGTGRSNTTAIVNWLNNNGQTGRAAQVADSIIFGGYDDWFLPSKDELNAMHKTLKTNTATGLYTGVFWSSSEDYDPIAWSHCFKTNTQSYHNKDDAHRVRPIRSFSH